MTKESRLAEDKDMIYRFTRAIYKAQKWVRETDATEIAEVVAPYFEDSTIEILTSSIERYKEQESFAFDPLLSTEAWDNLLQIMDEDGELQGDSPYDVLVDKYNIQQVLSAYDVV